MNKEKDLLLVIDGEFSGPSVTTNFIVEIGACLYNPETQTFIDEFETFCKKPADREWDTVTRTQFWEKKGMEEVLAEYQANQENYPDCNEAITAFAKWAQKLHSQYPGQITICADYPEIDMCWFNYLLGNAKLPPLHLLLGKFIPTCGLASFHQGLSQTLHSELKLFTKNFGGNWNHMTAALSFVKKDGQALKPTHRALNDAKVLAQNHGEILRGVLEMRKSIENFQSSLMPGKMNPKYVPIYSPYQLSFPQNLYKPPYQINPKN